MWHPKPALLPTPWTHLVGPANALPQYPRPQLVRKQWLNLNGVWGYTGRRGPGRCAAAPAGRLPRTDPRALSHRVGAVRHRSP